MTELTHTLHFYFISDSIGETSLKVAKSALAQFPSVRAILHKFMFIHSKEELLHALKEAQAQHGIICLTVADTQLFAFAQHYAAQHQLTIFNVIEPISHEISKRTGLAPSKEIGAQHHLSSEYFDRVKAMEFCMMYDDGKDPSGLLEADIVLLGISRTSKTPLSMYLGNLGYKVANLPIIPENTLPSQLFQVDKRKIVGLTTSADVVNQHRESRMKEYGLSSGSKYASLTRVNEELTYASSLYEQLDCVVINTAQLSIEETASIIIEALNLPIRYY